MPKYTADNGDWVEISGAARLSMRKLDGLYSGDRAGMFGLAQSVIIASAFQTDEGLVDAGKQTFYHPHKLINEDAVEDAPAPIRTFDNMLALTLQQWDWLRERIFQAARDEVLDPQP